MKSMSRNTGKSSEAFFEENVSGVVFRLRDKADLVGLNGGKNVAAFGNPSDYFLIDPNGVGKFVEVKSSISKVSFSLSGFTPAQRAAMARCHKAGHGDSYHIYVHSLDTDTWYRMNATDFYNTIMKEKRKSLKWTELTLLTSW